MYSTCIFCNKPLGSNEVLERFPVGRRIAFDSAMGRLWVVCRSCERWNLSPLDERLEVIDECEELYSNERKRVSTENIGLAKLNEGLELVRIGQPLRPEFAAWRYGDQFGRRRRNTIIKSGVLVAAVGGIVVVGWQIGAIGGFVGPIDRISKRLLRGSPERIVARMEGRRPGLKFGRAIELKQKELDRLFLAPDPADGYVVTIPHDGERYEMRGEEAQRVLSQVLPAINAEGGSKKNVATAVKMIESAHDPAAFVKRAAVDNKPTAFDAKTESLMRLPKDVRLALEMAVHEDAERRALEGELLELEAAWRSAEEIAAISDSLLTSSSITAALERLKK